MLLLNLKLNCPTIGKLRYMRDTYDSEGMGFNYRGQYFAYSTESGSYTGASGGVIAGPNPYTYNWSNGKYYDSKGNEVSYFEVHNNYILPNATPIKEKYGHWVGKTRTISTTEFNGEIVDGKLYQSSLPTTIETIQWWIPYGSAGGGDDDNLLSSINETSGIISLLSGTINNFVTQTRLGSDVAYYLSNNKAFLNSAKYVKSIGYWAAGLGIGTDVMMSYTGSQSWTETGINAAVTGVALYIGGWPGIGISLMYNGIKLQIEQYQNVPSDMDKHWRRYSPGPY